MTGCGSTGHAANTTAAAAEGTAAAAESNDASATGDAGSAADAASADAAGTTEKRKIIAVTGASPRPFTYYDENNELTGQNIELTEAIFAKLPQYELEWEVTEFSSIFAGLDSGRYQLGVNNFAMNDERKEKYLYTDPIYSDLGIILANKDIELPDKDTLTFEDLAGYTYVGVPNVNWTTYVENYNAEHPDKQINIAYVESGSTDSILNVQNGKYDFTLADGPSYYGYTKPEFGYDLQEKVLEGTKQYSYFIAPKGEDQLVADFNAALREVIEDGTSKAINEKYFNQDYTTDPSELSTGN